MNIVRNKFKTTEGREVLVKKWPDVCSLLDQNRSGGTNVCKSLVFETRYVLRAVVSFIITVTLQASVSKYGLYVKVKVKVKLSLRPLWRNKR